MEFLSRVEKAVQAYKTGLPVIIIDDFDRENEGDICIPAEIASPEIMNTMIRFGRGLVCVAMDNENADRVGLVVSPKRNHDPFQTRFTVSVDYKEGLTTGISAKERSNTAKALANKNTLPDDFVIPGHVFPIIAEHGGVLRRKGHTEASVDLAKIAGFNGVSCICEVIKDDGEMARFDDLKVFAEKHNMPLLSVEDIYRYRFRAEQIVNSYASANLPTKNGDFTIHAFINKYTREEISVLEYGDVSKSSNPVPIRIHSSCVTGDIFGSCKCDCGPQLQKSIDIIKENGTGMVIYLFQEGRGIGFANKILAYSVQESGKDTYEANIHVGFREDEREYGNAAQVIKLMGLSEVQLITNNPLKIKQIEEYGIIVEKRIECRVGQNTHNARYLESKKIKGGHIL